MAALYRHARCVSLIAAYGGEGLGYGDSRSDQWLIRTSAGEMVRPRFNSDDRAFCPDCCLRVFPNPVAAYVAPFDPVPRP